MKPALLLFLCFGFLLLSGSSHSCLPVSPQGSHATLNFSFKVKQPVQSFFQLKNTVIHSATGTENEYGFPNAIEPEDNDDDYKSFVKQLQWSDSLPQLFQMQLYGGLQRYRKDRLPACLYFALLSSDKFITYRVIRI